MGIGTLIYAVTCWQTYYQSAGWDKVPARMESAELESNTGDESTTYSVNCRYTYVYNGQSYTGKRVGVVGGSTSDYGLHAGRADILREHASSGEPFTALVDPGRPERAILFREIDPWMRIMIPFGLTFAVMGAAFSAGGAYHIHLGRRHERLRRITGDKPWLFRDDWKNCRVNPSVFRLIVKYTVTLVVTSLLATLGIVFWGHSFMGLMPKIGMGILALGFGLVLLSGIRYILARLVNGPMRLHLNERPLAPGMALVAAINGPERLKRAKSAELTLLVTKQGDESESKLHSEKLVVEPSSFAEAAGRNVLIPVSFHLPADKPPLSNEFHSPVTWRVELRTKGLFLGPSLTFNLPVFAPEKEKGRNVE